MIKVTYKEKTYEFKNAFVPHIYGTHEVYNDWRETDYNKSPHALLIGASSCFDIPRSMFKELYDSEIFDLNEIQDEIDKGNSVEDLLFDFRLEIKYTKIINIKTYETELIGNIKNKFPTFKALENLVLDDAITDKSTIELSDYFVFQPVLKEIKFGQIKDNIINLICTSYFETYNEIIGTIEIDLWLPIRLSFQASLRTDSFPEKSIKEIFTEVKDCFASLYNISEYNLNEKVVNEERRQVLIDFKLKTIL